jgi:hypothetical protein
VCDSSDQAAHYHTVGPKLGASSLTRHLDDFGVQIQVYFLIYTLQNFGHRGLSASNVESFVKISTNIAVTIFRVNVHWFFFRKPYTRHSQPVWRGSLACCEISEICREISEMCREISEMCREISEMCREISEMCREISEMCCEISEMCREIS